jgi:hypothetical protein
VAQPIFFDKINSLTFAAEKSDFLLPNSKKVPKVNNRPMRERFTQSGHPALDAKMLQLGFQMFSKMFTSKRKHESDAATIRVTG